MNNTKTFGWIIILACCGLTATAQEQFELVAPELQISSRAIRTDATLQVVGSDGTITTYDRESRFDSADGAWLGYFSRAANQIVRWPKSGTGNMQIGNPQAGSVAYRTSRMSIRAAARDNSRVAQRPVLPPTGGEAGLSIFNNLQPADLGNILLRRQDAIQRPEPQALLLASVDQAGSPWVLSRGVGNAVTCVASPAEVGTQWWITPAGAGYVRIQSYQAGRPFAVSGSRGNALVMQPIAQDARQLWRLVAGRGPQRYALENAFYNGNCLTQLGAGRVGLQPTAFAANQLWVSLVPPTAVTVQPFWRSVSHEIHANPQLPPAELELRNTHRSALIVLLGDARQGPAFESIRIEPGSSKTVTLDRDAGATIVENVEIRSPAGVWDRQQFVTAIPPTAFYDLSVYEEHLQSIAIDRTGKSPNPIEDVNYVPKSIGWLSLPAGAALPQRGQIDVYARAVEARNPGAVRRMDPKQFDDPPEERPLESILKQFQSMPRKSF